MSRLDKFILSNKSTNNHKNLSDMWTMEKSTILEKFHHNFLRKENFSLFLKALLNDYFFVMFFFCGIIYTSTNFLCKRIKRNFISFLLRNGNIFNLLPPTQGAEKMWRSTALFQRGFTQHATATLPYQSSKQVMAFKKRSLEVHFDKTGKRWRNKIKRYLFWEACADLFENLLYLNKHRTKTRFLFLLNTTLRHTNV